MSADRPLASSAPPRQYSAAVFIALPSSCSYRRQDDAKKGGVSERRLPVDGAFSMNDEVRKRRHECGHNHGYGKHGYKIDKERLEVHVSGSWRLERQNPGSWNTGGTIRRLICRLLLPHNSHGSLVDDLGATTSGS